MTLSAENTGGRWGPGQSTTPWDDNDHAYDTAMALLYGDAEIGSACYRGSIDYKVSGTATANLRGIWFKEKGGRKGSHRLMAGKLAEQGRRGKFSQMFPIAFGTGANAVLQLEATVDNKMITRNPSAGTQWRYSDFAAECVAIMFDADDGYRRDHGTGLFEAHDVTLFPWEVCMGWTPWSAWKAHDATGDVDLMVEAWMIFAQHMQPLVERGLRLGVGFGRPGFVERPGWPGLGARIVDKLVAAGAKDLGLVALEIDLYRRSAHCVDSEGRRFRVAPADVLDDAYWPEMSTFYDLCSKNDLDADFGEWAVNVDDPNFVLYMARWMHDMADHGYLHSATYFFKPRDGEKTYNVIGEGDHLGWDPFLPEASAMFARVFGNAFEDPSSIDYATPEYLDASVPWTDDEGQPQGPPPAGEPPAEEPAPEPPAEEPAPEPEPEPEPPADEPADGPMFDPLDIMDAAIANLARYINYANNFVEEGNHPAATISVIEGLDEFQVALGALTAYLREQRTP